MNAQEEAGTRHGRSIEKTIDIQAPAQDVWRALTDADELVRWFPLEAEVTPGVGGKIRMHWDDCAGGEGTIDAWEPNRLLRTSHGMPAPDGGIRIVTEFTLESRAGTTRLRLVHFGFGEDSEWDHLYDGTIRGWDFELRGLRHYLERHKGEPRRVIHARGVFDHSLDRAWKLLVGPQGIDAEGALGTPGEGDAYRLRTAGGLPLEGTVCIHREPKDFAATVANLEDAYLRVRIDESYDGSSHNDANLWLSTYGLDDATFARLERELEAIVKRHFDRAS